MCRCGSQVNHPSGAGPPIRAADIRLTDAAAGVAGILDEPEEILGVLFDCA